MCLDSHYGLFSACLMGMMILMKRKIWWTTEEWELGLSR